MVDLFEPIAARLADADRLAAEPRLEMTDRLVLCDLGAGKPGAGRDPVRHRIGDELRPPLAPQIVGDLGAVRIGDQPAHLVRPLGDRAVDFASAINRVRRAPLDPAAMDFGDHRLVHAVLQRDDIAAGATYWRIISAAQYVP